MKTFFDVRRISVRLTALFDCDDKNKRFICPVLLSYWSLAESLDVLTLPAPAFLSLNTLIMFSLIRILPFNSSALKCALLNTHQVYSQNSKFSSLSLFLSSPCVYDVK